MKDFKVYNFSGTNIDGGMVDVLSKGFTFIPVRWPNLAEELIDLKLFLRKLNFKLFLVIILMQVTTLKVHYISIAHSTLHCIHCC